MLYFTQLIYIKEGQEETFHRFEDVAIPIIAKYNGRMLLRLRPDEAAFIDWDGSAGRPYEVHIGSFDTEQDFRNFMQDEERKQFLHLKAQSIRATVLIKGEKL